MRIEENKTVENIINLVEWFEEFQPEDLDQIERILLGLRYVDKDIIKNDVKQDIYRNIKLIKAKNLTKLLSGVSRSYLCMDINNRYKQKQLEQK